MQLNTARFSAKLARLRHNSSPTSSLLDRSKRLSEREGLVPSLFSASPRLLPFDEFHRMQLDVTASKAASELTHPSRSVPRIVTGAVLGLALGLGGCSAVDNLPGFSSFFGGEKYETKILPDIPADSIYDQGLARLHKKDYTAAAKSFGDLEKQYPYSQWSRKGLIMTTFSQYEEGKYEDAIASANRYVSLYPSSPETPYAMYLAGMSYYNQIPDVARDQERAEKALAYFNQIVEKYPQSEYATDAKFKMQVARDQLAGKEMTVGRNYPDSQWYKDAFSRLQTGGLSPEEHSDSWISKTFKKVGLG